MFSGSLLDTRLEGVRSLPVGYVAEVEMFPLDFEEFARAGGVSPDLFATVAQHFQERTPVSEFLHERLMRLYRRYLLVGGMPDAVNVFLEQGTLDPVRATQQEISKHYLRDIAKYAPKDQVLTIQGIYRLVSSELSGKNRRFRLKSVPDVKRFDNMEDELLWLTNAGVAISVNNTAEPAPPLMMTRESGRFKLYYSDVGLLRAALVKDASLDLLDGKKAMSLDGVYENAVAQELHPGHRAVLPRFAQDRRARLRVRAGRRRARAHRGQVQRGLHNPRRARQRPRREGLPHRRRLDPGQDEREGRRLLTYLPLYMAGVV